MIELAHVNGFLILGSDGIEISNDKESRWGHSVVEEIAGKLPNTNLSISKMQEDPNADFSDGVEVSVHIPNVFLRIYFSDNEKTLEEVQEAVILNTMGALDLYQEWYGYSSKNQKTCLSNKGEER